MGQVLWVHYSVPLEYCKAWDQRLCPIGCQSHLLTAPLNTPSSFRLQLSSFLPPKPPDICRVSLGSDSQALRSAPRKAPSPGFACQGAHHHCRAGSQPPAPWSLCTTHKRGTEAYPALQKNPLGLARSRCSFQSSRNLSLKRPRSLFISCLASALSLPCTLSNKEINCSLP